MVIINCQAGQLANRLFYFSHFLANSIEHGYRLINPWFHDYAHLFDCTDRNDFSPFRVSVRFSRFRFPDKIFRMMIRYLSLPVSLTFKKAGPFYVHQVFEYDRTQKVFDLNDPGFQRDIRRRIVFADGWMYRDRENFIRYAPLIRQFFTPKETYRQQIETLIRNCRDHADVLVGVHVRRGDYSRFKEGKFFFDDQVYTSKMTELKELFEKEGKRCHFLICSNELINRENYPGLHITTGHREPVVDIYALARCDYILGPPSTFTMWASFYGEVPVFHLQHAGQQMRLKNAVVTKGI